MDIKELNKTQLILLTLLITFVVSIATGIVTVSLMNQMPKSASQTINNVIQRTIEKVTTTPAATTDKKSSVNFSDGAVLVPIYNKDFTFVDVKNVPEGVVVDPMKPLTEGVVLSDAGLILVDAVNISKDEDMYTIALNKELFGAKVIKRFSNGFVFLQIQAVPKKDTTDTKTPTPTKNTVDKQ